MPLEQLTGEELDFTSLFGANCVVPCDRTLIYYDGPVVWESHLRDGTPALVFWADADPDARVNRDIIHIVTQDTKDKLYSGALIRETLTGDFVYIVEYSHAYGTSLRKLYKVKWEDIPGDYLPTVDAVFDPQYFHD